MVMGFVLRSRQFPLAIHGEWTATSDDTTEARPRRQNDIDRGCRGAMPSWVYLLRLMVDMAWARTQRLSVPRLMEHVARGDREGL